VAFWRRRGAPDVSDLEAEGLLHCEIVPGSVTYRHYRAPGRYSSWKKEPARWTVAVTRRRLVVRRDSGPMVNVPWADARIRTLRIAVDGPDLLVGADASAFRADSSGTVETRARVGDPAAVVALIERMRGSR
jgi:hypothetical protein